MLTACCAHYLLCPLLAVSTACCAPSRLASDANAQTTQNTHNTHYTALVLGARIGTLESRTPRTPRTLHEAVTPRVNATVTPRVSQAAGQAVSETLSPAVRETACPAVSDTASSRELDTPLPGRGCTPYCVRDIRHSVRQRSTQSRAALDHTAHGTQPRHTATAQSARQPKHAARAHG